MWWFETSYHHPYTTMVVYDLLRWRAPAVLILLIVLLVQNDKLAPASNEKVNNFVEVFAGNGAISLACWHRGLIGSAHDIKYTTLMDMASVHGFALLVQILRLHFFWDWVFNIVIPPVNLKQLWLQQLKSSSKFSSLPSYVLRLVCREIWNTAPGGIAVFGICCNSFTKMLLAWNFVQSIPLDLCKCFWFPVHTNWIC